MPFLPNFKKTKKRTGRSAEPNAIASQVEAMNMYKRTGEATASGSAAPAHADDEDTGGIGSVDSSTLNNARAARRGAGGVITTTASSHDRDNDNKKKRRRLNDGDDDDADHDTLSHASNTKRQRSNLLQSKGGGSDYHSPLVSSKIPSPGIGRDASPMYSPPEVDHHSSALTIRHDDSLDRKTDLDGGWACDNCWNLNEAQAERCSSCNQLQKTDQKSPPRKKSAEDSKEADEIARVESSSLSTNRSRKVKVPRRITGEVPALKKLKKIELKPDLRVGDEVWAAWWENRGEGEVCQAESGGWYPGRIKRVREQGGSDYGPQRYYDIEYDDGDELHGVDDVYVVRKEDYELSTRENVARWKGIALETDDNSTDLWAKRMGWYSVTIDGDDYRFPYLSQALRAYDDSVVRSKGVNTYPSDLNLAEEWKFSKRIRKQDAREKDARTEEIARRLKGCSFNEAYGRYSAQISFSGVEKVTKNIGFYELKADAAFAYDEAAKKLGVAASRGLNYSSPDEHLDVRNREMEKRGISVNIATVKAKVADKTKDYKPADVKKKSDSTASSSDGTRKKKKEKKKKTPASKYELVTFNAGNNVFDTRIVDPASGRRIFLGSYEYASDAALAADLGIRHLRANNSIVNFASVDEYHKAKKEEAAINPGKCSFTVADINSRVHAALKSKKKSPAKNGPKSKPKSTANQAAKTNPPCPHVDPIYDALETKWGKHLDKKTGREFMSDYQHFIQDSMRGLEACDSIKRSRSSHEGGAPIINDPFSNDPNAAQLPTVRTVQTATEEDVARDNPRKSFKPESPSKKEAPTFRTLFRKLSSGNASEKGSPSSESRKVTPKSFGSGQSPTSHLPTKEVSFQSMPNLPFPAQPSVASKPDNENGGEADDDMPHYESQQTLPTRHLSKTHSESPASQPTIKLNDEQVEELSLPFPRGCQVWYHLNSGKSSTSFRQGSVYEIRMSLIDSKECQYYVKETFSTRTLKLTENELCYAPASPIYVKAPDGSGETIPGEILLCRALPNPAVNRTHELKKSLDLALEAGKDEEIASLLHQLDEIEISRRILAETKVGKSVTNTTKCSDEILAQKAKDIVQKWKEIAEREKGGKEEGGLKFGGDNVYAYNVLVSNNEQNHFHIEEGVLPDRVQYRYVPENIDGGENESSNSTITTQPNGGY